MHLRASKSQAQTMNRVILCYHCGPIPLQKSFLRNRTMALQVPLFRPQWLGRKIAYKPLDGRTKTNSTVPGCLVSLLNHRISKSKTVLLNDDKALDPVAPQPPAPSVTGFTGCSPPQRKWKRPYKRQQHPMQGVQMSVLKGGRDKLSSGVPNDISLRSVTVLCFDLYFQGSKCTGACCFRSCQEQVAGSTTGFRIYW